MVEVIEGLGPLWAALMLLLVTALGLALVVLGGVTLYRQRHRHA